MLLLLVCVERSTLSAEPSYAIASFAPSPSPRPLLALATEGIFGDCSKLYLCLIIYSGLIMPV